MARLFPTAHMLAAAYEYLRTSPPFRAWKLPHADAVEFGVTAHRDRDGDHCVQSGEHCIRVSASRVRTTDLLMQTVAHEMIHARQQIARVPRTHSGEFHRLARRVCSYHGWDEEKFSL